MPRPTINTAPDNNHGNSREQQHGTMAAHLEHLRAQQRRAHQRNQHTRVAQLQSEIKTITAALADSGVDAHSVYIRPLPDIIIAQVRNRCIEVDPCITRNTDKLTHALMHEKEHLDGLFNEAIIELRVQTRRRVRRAFYLDDIKHMDKIIKYIDLETLTRYCKQHRFTELYKLYRDRARRNQQTASHRKTPRTNVSDAELRANFLRAFPELRASRSRKTHKKRGRE